MSEKVSSEALQLAKEALRSGLKEFEESQGVDAFSAGETQRKSTRPPLSDSQSPSRGESSHTKPINRVYTMSRNNKWESGEC